MRKPYLKISLAILSIVMFCWGCRTLLSFLDPLGFEGRPDVILKRDEYYAINSQTILRDISKGESIQLTLVPGEQDIRPSNPPVVSWTQEDYLQVANAIFFSVWKKLPANWKLGEIAAQTNCSGAELGFQRMIFSFFNVTKKSGKYAYTERHIFIIPEKNLVWIYELERSPVTPLMSWQNGLDVKKIIPAQEALRIAEENGGRQARLDINRCTISTDIIAGSNHDNWQVWYTSDRNFFFMEIDEKSGHIIGFWKE